MRWLIALALVIGTTSELRADPAEARAEARYKDGMRLFAAGDFDAAYEEYQAAYTLAPRALLLYHMARARHRAAKLPEALDLYRQYLADEPNGKAADDARVQRDLLAAQLEPPAPPPPDLQPAHVVTQEPVTPIEHVSVAVTTKVEPAPSRYHWPWLAGAVVAVVGGVLLDTLPASASNHKVDALDFAPVGLYGIGIGCAIHGMGWL